ncbi:MAG: hypothetical protein HN356_11275 [Calditrichaeota bacterium]|nr:hypothetical protein [Calditrichota bacterium]
MLRIWIVLLTISLLLLSCSDESNPSEPIHEHFKISINQLPGSISGIVGTTQERSFYVDLKRDDDTVVENEEITLIDASEIGQMTPEKAVTTETGEVAATYSVVMPAEETTSRIRVTANNQSASERVTLHPIRRPATIRFEMDRRYFAVGVDTIADVPIVAIVSDSGGTVIPGVHVAFSLESDGNHEVFGSVTNSCVTDSLGRAITNFRSFNQYGGVLVLAQVEESGFEENISCSSTLQIRSKFAAHYIYLHASPDEFNISQISPRNTTCISTIMVVVTDSTGVGIPLGPNFQLSTTHGLIVDGMLYFNPETDMEGTESFTITLTGHIPGIPEDGRTEVQVNFLDDLPTLTLGSDRYIIAADGPGGSQANLHVTLATPQGMPVEGVEITFRGTENRCVIQSPVLTDSLGSATAVFDDIGRPGLVVISAESKYGVSDSIDIEIGEYFSRVGRISLDLENIRMRANSGDSTHVTAVCSLVDGFPARQGTIVNFRANYGSFPDQTVPINRDDGIAETFYIAGNQVRTDIVEAFVVEEEDTVFSNSVEVILQSGPPARIVIHASPNVLHTNDPGAYAVITSTVLDTSGNPVREGPHVQYETTLGTIRDGARLYPDGQVGLAIVTGFVETPNGRISDQTTVNFVAETPNSIELVSNVQFANYTGHPHPAVVLTATVRDIDGRLITVPTPVLFEILNEPEPPGGCSFGHGVDQSFVSYTGAGRARATLNIGWEIGGKVLRATTWRDSAARPNSTISITYAGFAVVGGPPFQLEISVNNRGIDAGGGAWELEVSARIWDIHRNPVQDRIPVVFTVEPEIASIEAGWTGNENRAGATVPGLAFVPIVYNSISSLEEVTISAVVQTERGRITHSIDHTLPIQGGIVILEEAGGDFIFDNDEEVIEAQFTPLLFDGHQIRIENATYTFIADFGEFDPEQPGNWSASMDDIFFDPDTNEQQVRFIVRVNGTDIVSEPVDIMVRRR